jgi:hypothetical protein
VSVFPDDDSDLAGLREAADFMQKVREGQAKRGKRFTGHNYLKPQQEQAVREAVESSELVRTIREAVGMGEAVTTAAERFEVMCKRQHIEVKDVLRPFITKLLTSEMWVNQESLGVPANKVVGITVLHGAVGPQLHEEFGNHFRDWAIKEAAVQYPGDPRGFLCKAKDQMDVLMREPEFERFRDFPSIIMDAAVRHTSSPREHLRKSSKKIDNLVQDPEFARLRGDPKEFIFATMFHSNPRAYLRELAQHREAQPSWETREAEKQEASRASPGKNRPLL